MVSVSPLPCRSSDMSPRLLLLDGLRDSWQPSPLLPSVCVLGAEGGEDESDTGALRVVPGRRDTSRDPIGEAAATASRTFCHPPAGCQYLEDNLGSLTGCGVGGCIKAVGSVWWSDEASGDFVCPASSDDGVLPLTWFSTLI